MQSTNFTLSAPPNTDIWRKPPTTDVFNAPHTLGPSKPLSSFTSARITVSAPWRQRYDQGGLLLRISKPSDPASAPRWIKTGVEFYEGQPRVSTVACDEWADWSIFPRDSGDVGDATTVEVRREGDELGRSLWVYYLVIGEDGEVATRHPLREVNWVFARLDEGLEVQVGAYAARPAASEAVEGEELKVSFKDLVMV